jgi:hypothetical protein
VCVWGEGGGQLEASKAGSRHSSLQGTCGSTVKHVSPCRVQALGSVFAAQDPSPPPPPITHATALL